MLTKSEHFWTTYLPCLVNVVCEQPPRPLNMICLLTGNISNGYLTPNLQTQNLLCAVKRGPILRNFGSEFSAAPSAKKIIFDRELVVLGI